MVGSWVWAALLYYCFFFNQAQAIALTQDTVAAPVVEETGDILGNSSSDWSGTKTQCVSSDCWAGTTGGESPSFNASGVIRWGYGGGTLEQNIAIASILASNTGISVEGYRYSWRLKNADANRESTNGAGGQDPLIITVEFYDNNNRVVETNTYDYSYHIDAWTWFSGTEWFKSSYLADELSSVSVFAEGDDAGFWKGWYGPELSEYSLSLLYSVDACISDPLSDTNCPGYADAYLNMMCTADALYDRTCPGYTEAYALANITEEASSTDNNSGVDTTGGTGISNTGVIDETAIVNDAINDGTPNETFSENTFVENVEVTTSENTFVDPTGVQNVAELTSEPVTIEEVVTFEEVAIIDEIVAEDPQQDALEEANSLELDKMSPREVIGALSKLGILGNSTTNGTGDPTGLGRDTVDGVSSISGEQLSLDGTSDNSTGAIEESTSISSTSSSLSSFNSSEMTTSFTSASDLPNNGIPDNISTNDLGQQADGSYNMLAEIDGSVFMVTIEESSQNPSETGGDPQKDLHSVFGGVESIEDNLNGLYIDSEESVRHETFAKRMLKKRITEINNKNNSAEEDEKIVQAITEESYSEADALSVNDVSQTEVVQEMNSNGEFETYTNNSIPEIDFYDSKDIYVVNLPENKNGLRNGLAQQLLHKQMIEMQYDVEN